MGEVRFQIPRVLFCAILSAAKDLDRVPTTGVRFFTSPVIFTGEAADRLSGRR